MILENIIIKKEKLNDKIKDSSGWSSGWFRITWRYEWKWNKTKKEMILPNSYDDEKQEEEEEISNNDRKIKYDDDSLSMFEPSISKGDAKNKLRDIGANLYRDKIVYDTENSRLLWPEEKKLVDNKTNESFEYF